MAEDEHSGVPHWAAHRIPFLPSENKTFFHYQYFTSASRETLEVNACQLMDGDGIRTFKTNMENGASWTRACTLTPKSPDVPWPWSTAREMVGLANRDRWWPPKHPWCSGRELSRAHRNVLFIVLYIVFTVKENTNGYDKLQLDVLSLQSRH